MVCCYSLPVPLTEDGDLLQEGLVQLSLPDGAAHQDAAVRVPVYRP